MTKRHHGYSARDALRAAVRSGAPLEPGQESPPTDPEARRRAMRLRLAALSGHHWTDADATDAQDHTGGLSYPGNTDYY